VISALPTETLTDERVDQLSQDHHKCPICMEDFKAGDVVKRLPCLHAYHQSCIDEWLRVC
jgi:hypothetical protein